MTQPTIILNNEKFEIELEPIYRAVKEFRKQYPVGNDEITISIVSNQEVQRVNKEFRAIDHPTDVLSFPAPKHIPGQLGDILVSYNFAQEQAERRNVEVEDELAMLTIHGCLHLAGYDDENESDRDDMIQRMNKIMASANLPTDENWSSLPHEVS